MSARKAPADKPAEARVGLQRAWAETVLVADWLRAEHPEHADRARLAVREITTALLALDRIVAELE